MSMSIINSLLEITLPNDDDFLKIKETLTRIGIASKKDKTLYQSCHILHKRGRYYIVHFKELFMLDGRPSKFTEDDMARRNMIAVLLKEWGLVNIINTEAVNALLASTNQIKIISYKEKSEWVLNSKYTVGKKRH